MSKVLLTRKVLLVLERRVRALLAEGGKTLDLGHVVLVWILLITLVLIVGRLQLLLHRFIILLCKVVTHRLPIRQVR